MSGELIEVKIERGHSDIVLKPYFNGKQINEVLEIKVKSDSENINVVTIKATCKLKKDNE